jgi:hypothetical protein
MKLMHIDLYRIDRGERVSNCSTSDNTVTKIEVEDDHYNITSVDIWTGKETVYTVPTDKYEVVINRFN